jgi:hypothetical protein
VQRGYPELAGVSAAAFADTLEPLRDRAPADDSFVLVVKSELAPAAETIERVERRGKPGFSVFEREDLERFALIQEVDLPPGPAYLLTAPDTGADTRNVTPDDAFASIRNAGRSPLTIDEGIALVTHDPEAVAKNAGFSLLASRCGDRRVTALWISDNRPKLGWCWAGNPHTWLGSASCAARIGA